MSTMPKLSRPVGFVIMAWDIMKQRQTVKHIEDEEDVEKFQL